MRKIVFALCAAAIFFSVSPPVFSQEGKDEKEKNIDRLTTESRLALVRFISSEFVRVIKPLPCGKKGVYVIGAVEQLAEQPKDGKGDGNKAIKGDCETTPGARMQITRLEFGKDNIRIDLNGGTSGRKGSWRDRIRIGIGNGGGTVGAPSGDPTSAPKGDSDGMPAGFENLPATIILEFGGPVPDITPDEFKQRVASVLDFSKARSAAVHWIDTLSPEVREAIAKNQVIVGMDEEEVIAAVGKPATCGKPTCKIREKDENGVEMETWLYGRAPFVMFVRFVGGKVVEVKKME